MCHILLISSTMARPDPYISDADLFRARRLRMRVTFRMAIFMGLYLALMQLWISGLLHVDRVFINAGVSVLVQLVALRFSNLLREDMEVRDFSPYRAEPTTGAQ
jgi:hypothetical protein